MTTLPPTIPVTEEVRRLFTASYIHFSDLRDHPDLTMSNLAFELDDAMKRLLAEGATRLCIQWRNTAHSLDNPNRDRGYFIVTGFRPKPSLTSTPPTP